jgi:hypothetical protein
MKRTLQIAPNLVALSEHASLVNSLGMSVGTCPVEPRARRSADHQNISNCYAISDSLIRWSYPEVDLS